MISIFVVDDHPLACLGLKQAIEGEESFEFLGFSHEATEAFKRIRKLMPDVVMLDITMPGKMDGYELARRLLRACPDLKVLIATAHRQAALATRLLQLGVHGYLVKDANNMEIVRAIRSVHAGKRYLPFNLSQEIAMQKVNRVVESPFERLSRREWQIASLMLQGMTISQIAEIVHLTSKTIHGHRYKILYKLSVMNDIQLFLLAQQYGMVDANTQS